MYDSVEIDSYKIMLEKNVIFEYEIENDQLVQILVKNKKIFVEIE
jgi:hypothetical protein